MAEIDFIILKELEWHCNHRNNIQQHFKPNKKLEKELADIIARIEKD